MEFYASNDSRWETGNSKQMGPQHRKTTSILFSTALFSVVRRFSVVRCKNLTKCKVLQRYNASIAIHIMI